MENRDPSRHTRPYTNHHCGLKKAPAARPWRSPRPQTKVSYRQLSITPPTSQNLHPTLDIRPNNRDIARKLANSNEEVSKQNEQTVQLDQEARQRPAEENEEDTGAEGGCAFELLGAGEEDQCLLEADDEG